MYGGPGTNPSQITTDDCISIISFNPHISPKSWWNQDLEKLANFSRFSIASKLQNKFILLWLAYKAIDLIQNYYIALPWCSYYVPSTKLDILHILPQYTQYIK